MNHERMAEEVMALIDGQLSGGRRSAAEAHLENCRECRASASEWRLSRDLLSGPRLPSSEAFVTAVMAKLAVEPVGTWAGFRILVTRWLLPVTAAAAFAGFVALMVVPASETSPATAESLLYSEVEDQLPSAWLVSASGAPELELDVVSEDI